MRIIAIIIPRVVVVTNNLNGEIERYATNSETNTIKGNINLDFLVALNNNIGRIAIIR